MSVVCLTVFNRPEKTRRVFERIAAAKPARLLVAADGPRDWMRDDERLCEETRSIVKNVDWECEAVFEFSDENRGSRIGTVAGITKAFDMDESAIILTDDCLAEPTFFRFCDELLDRFKDEEKIMSISGTNYLAHQPSHPASYYFSRHPDVWGWATWARAWRSLDQDLNGWSDLRGTRWLEDLLASKSAARYWTDIFDSLAEAPKWDYAWVYACWRNGGVAISPHINMVSNIGFGADATNTSVYDPALADLATFPMEFPLVHPDRIEVDEEADSMILKREFGILEIDPWSRVKRIMHRGMRTIRGSR